MLITIASFQEPYEAHMLCGRLHSEGLFAVVAHEYHVGNNWGWSTALGGTKVQVLLHEEEEARSIERLCRAGEIQSELAGELGDLDDPRCPACNSTDYWKRRPLLQAAFAIIISLATVCVVPPLRWICFCNKCGTKFGRGYGLIGKVNASALPALRFTEATLADIPEIHRLRMAVRENVLSDPLRVQPSDIARMIDKNGKGWVCKIDGTLRGFSFADLRAHNLWALFIDPDFERCGIGRELHNSAVDWLFANGAATIWLTTAPGTRAEKFYRAAGWKLKGEESNGDYRLELERVIWAIRRRKF